MPFADPVSGGGENGGVDNELPLTSLFWAKSNAGGVPHSLVGHLRDTAAVGELLWDRFLAPKVHRQLNDAAGGARGRDLLVALCALHDVGKATPAFQIKLGGDSPVLEQLRRRGLALPLAPAHSMAHWPHPKASVVIARALAHRHGVTGCEWVYSMLEGHHGRYLRPPVKLKAGDLYNHGDVSWQRAQLELADAVLSGAGIILDGWALQQPTRGVQLALGGLLVMADWIASSDLFPGDGMRPQSMDRARSRAEAAWSSLGLVRGWNDGAPIHDASEFERRFGFGPRPLQELTLRAAETMPTPCLYVVEAPMGEGKTEAALGAAEIIARRHGLSGLVFAMPTQGTTDAMYARVREWMANVDPSVTVSLLHGKAMLNEAWVNTLSQHRMGEVHGDEHAAKDAYGMTDEFGTARGASSLMASYWLLGRHRGLLSPVVVATVDQVLWAATRTKFVALRHAGLIGRVVVIDEVHSYDAYMSVFLHELLRWCARMGTPVVLMSATLASPVRAGLVRAWREGCGSAGGDAAQPTGFPSVLAIDGGTTVGTSCEQYRQDLEVAVGVLPLADPDDIDALADSVVAATESGGCALVILNVVARAQAVWRSLAARGLDALLIHGRLTAAERARRTEAALAKLGKDGERPDRFVVVATQIAEQSFDIDADILFTDIAPMDLLIQRIGRVHRHDRPAEARPAALRNPRVVVTGVAQGGALPRWPRSFTHVYRDWALLATSAELLRPTTWTIPSAVPALVERAYSAEWLGPPAWSAAVKSAREMEERERTTRQEYAAQWRLDADPLTEATTLVNLHVQSTDASEDTRTVVRDGDDTVEVSLIVAEAGGLRTLAGIPLGEHGERAADPAIARVVLGDSVRIRWFDGLETVGPHPQWIGLPLLGYQPVLTLDVSGAAQVGSRLLHYDQALGLSIE